MRSCAVRYGECAFDDARHVYAQQMRALRHELRYSCRRLIFRHDAVIDVAPCVIAAELRLMLPPVLRHACRA